MQGMDDSEASCIFYVKDGMFDQQALSRICILTVTKSGIVMLTIQYDLVFSVCFMDNPGDLLRQTSPDVITREGFVVYIGQTHDFHCR